MPSEQQIEQIKKQMNDIITLRGEIETRESICINLKNEGNTRGFSAAQRQQLIRQHTKAINGLRRDLDAALALIEKAEKPLYRQLLMLHFSEGFTWAEVADALNYSEKQVYRYYKAALYSIAAK